MKSKWKKRKHPRPTSTTIRGNSRQMLKVHIRDILSEEVEADYVTTTERRRFNIKRPKPEAA